MKFQIIRDNQSNQRNAEIEASLWNDLKILLARLQVVQLYLNSKMLLLHFEQKKTIFQKKCVPGCHMPSLYPQRMVWVLFCHRSAKSKWENFQPRLANQTGQRGQICIFSVFSMNII